VAMKMGMHPEREAVRPGGAVKRLYAIPARDHVEPG